MVAFDAGQGRAEGAARSRRGRSTRRRTNGCSPSARATRSSRTGSGTTSSEVMWGVLASAIAHQADDLAALPRVALPDARHRRRAGRAVPRAVAARWPRRSRRAELAVIPDAGHSPQFENPDAWIAALTEFLASVPTRDACSGVDAHGGRLARRGVAAPRRRHDVHVVGRPPVRAVRRRGAGRSPARRRAPRADRDVRGRRLGEGHPPARLRGADRGSGRHQRRERDDRGAA